MARTIRDWAEGGEALALLALAWPACRLVALRRLARRLPRVAPRRPRARTAERMVLAVDRATRVLGGRPTCLPRAWSAAAMMRRRGIDARLHLGLRNGAERLEGHAWVEVDGTAVIGGPEAIDFTSVAALGGPTG